MAAYMMKRNAAIALVFLAGLAVGAGLVSAGLGARPTKIDPGTEVFSAVEDGIMQISYATEDMTLTAQRSRPGDAFSVQATFADGRPPQHCTTTPDLSGQIKSFSHITANRQIDVNDLRGQFPVLVGVIIVRTQIIGEPMPPLVVRTSADGKSVAFAYNGFAVQAATPISVLTKLEGGCTALTIK
jgi:hypothetical protein